MQNHLLISDAAREVQVESHVLRYWEEELKLPIKRNELGHRYYTKDDVERFKQIKSMKERGLQLKAIKMILKDGRLDVLTQEGANIMECQENHLESRKEDQAESREEKAKRLQWIMQQMIRQAVQENNAELVQMVRESVLKELDYQFRMQEERDEERDKAAAERTESYYRKLDELLRRKSARKKFSVLIKRDNGRKTTERIEEHFFNMAETENQKNAAAKTNKAADPTGAKDMVNSIKPMGSAKKEKKKRHFAI